MGTDSVVREIPEWVTEGLSNKTLTEHGGVIRNLKGQIVAHLQFGDAEAMEKVGQALSQMSGQLNVLQGLQTATLALQGLNLVVSVAGFAIVCKKLNRISDQLVSMDARIQEVLQHQMQMEWKQELERRSRFRANLESLASGLNTNDAVVTGDALNRLRESAVFYEMLATHVASDVRAAYLDAVLVNEILRNVAAIRLSIAHAQALRGHLEEASSVLRNLRGWHAKQLEVLEKPLLEKPTPVWLGFPDYQKKKKQWQELVLTQRRIPEGIEYVENQIDLCKRKAISFQDLADMAARDHLCVYLEAA